ncbi:MAG: ATP-dependent sacrificial sulfur transferase LarE, partial [Planctomycetes bacterium]|nr:ATP-dependent sacrificial sulfur transferase LarE [Planctomycetota bacterium]
MIEQKLQEKVESVNQAFRSAGSALVAFSGGVDSALVLKLAIDVLGRERVLAVTARSPSVPSADLATVAALAAEIGAQHEFIDTREFDNPDYLANPSNRCYFCKTELYGHLSRLASERTFGIVANGVNADDLGDYRPGIFAAEEHDVAAPLAQAGISKAEVRALADERELSVHDKPASPCLSSRVQYGEQITPEKLERIDQAETFLRELGFRE